MEGILRYVNDMGEIMFPMTRKTVFKQFFDPKYIDIDNYFPSQIERVVGRLARKGWVEKVETSDGIKVIIKGDGKNQVMLYDVKKFEPKREKWDGKWRLVMFDVEERKKKGRDKLRKYLMNLGFWQMQKSVWICPFDCEKEMKYLREILNMSSEVKWAVIERIENEEELKHKFGLI